MPPVIPAEISPRTPSPDIFSKNYLRNSRDFFLRISSTISPEIPTGVLPIIPARIPLWISARMPPGVPHRISHRIPPERLIQKHIVWFLEDILLRFRRIPSVIRSEILTEMLPVMPTMIPPGILASPRNFSWKSPSASYWWGFSSDSPRNLLFIFCRSFSLKNFSKCLL